MSLSQCIYCRCPNAFIDINDVFACQESVNRDCMKQCALTTEFDIINAAVDEIGGFVVRD